MRYWTLIVLVAALAGIGVSDAAAQPATLESVSALQKQISILRRELRELKGEVERANHGIGQLENRIAKLVQDVDLRLQAIESRAASAAPETASAPATGQTASGGQPAPVGAPPRSPPPGQKALGVMSKSDYETARQNGKAPAPRKPPSLPAVTAPPKVAPAPSSAERLPQGFPADAPAQQQYDFAINLLYKRQLPEAEAALVAFVARHPKHDLAGNAMFWIAETHYTRKDYKKAVKGYYEAYKAYPKGRKAADILLKLALALGKLGEKESACSALAELESSHGDAEERILKPAARQKAQLGCA